MVAREDNPGQSAHVTVELSDCPLIGWPGQETRGWPLIGRGRARPEPGSLVEPRMS